MPVDIAPLVTGTAYDAVVEVAADTEVLTEAALTNTAVALGNRIEFVRGRVPDASATPERVYTLREDFLSSALDGNLIHADYTWGVTKSGSPTFTFVGSASKNPGNFAVFFPGDSATHEFYWYLQDDTANIGNLANIDHTTIIANRVGDGGVAVQCAWGWAEDSDLLNGGNNGLSLFYASFLPNWHIMLRKAGVQTLIDTGVVVTDNEYIVCRFLLQPSGDIDVEIDGVVVTTILSANKPVVDLTFGGRFVATTADAAPSTIATDFMFFSGRTSVRSGP